MRRGMLVLALSGALSLTGAQALAGNPSPTVIATSENEFFPKRLTVPPDTTVNFENRGLAHNVRFEDGGFEEPADPQPTPWRVWRHFDNPGVYRYYCEMHGGPGGQGMSGTIVVEAGADPVLDGLAVKPRKICNRRTRKCKRVAARIVYRLSEDARVSGGIDPVGGKKGRRSRDISVAGEKGKNSIKISGRRWQPGLYAVTLSAEDEDGNESDASTVHFRVKRARR